MENLEILKQALNIAIQKGCYNLGDVEAILKALNELNIQLQEK